MKILLLVILTFSVVFADEYLIKEMENLKNSLEKNDPDRTELSLRLADLYFDVSIQEGEGSDLVTHREKAAGLYESVLYGKEGLIAPAPDKAVKIRFQLARVLGKLNKYDLAKKYYLSVFEDELATKKFKRESALALAEFYEEEVNFERANHFYLKGIDLCESVETCNYAHYKRSWLLYKEVRLDEAIVELKKSLWDSKNQARDKVINDLLLFVSASVTDGHNELVYFKDLAQKTGQADLVRKLVEAFYGAGNRIAGSNVLVEWNEQNPSLFYELRLLEEFYGFRNWEKVRDYLGRIEKRSIADISSEVEEAKETKAMIKRVIVQLDSEAEQDEKYSPDLLRAIDVYLGFYPNDDMRVKLQQGWIKAQKDEEKKISRLQKWIKEDIAFGFDKDHIRKLRQTRLALAQKLNKSEIVLEEALAISEILTAPENREFKYVYAHELYKNKAYDKALPLFVELAKFETTPDSWAIKAQNLSLDIYNAKKDYKNLVAQASLWTSKDNVASDKKLATEINEMKKVQVQASFEATVLKGETKEALNEFFDFCFNAVFPEKSCVNAKVLAVKLADQDKLVKLLEREKDEKALMVEYELMGRFSEAAKLNEKFNLTKNADMTTYFKIALLYELDQNFKDRDRILNKLISKVKQDKAIDTKWEDALYLTLKEANLINAQTLSLNWSLNKKLQIANNLASNNEIKSDHNILVKSKTYTGGYWAKNVLTHAQKLANTQADISFYGAGSEWKFKKRIKALENLQKYVVEYLEGADVQTRIYLLDMLKKSFANFAFEILNTPLPEGLDAETLAQIQEQLKQMSSPYQLAAGNYENLQKEQFNTLKAEELTAYQAQLDADEITYADFITIEKPKESLDLSAIDYSPFNQSRTKLGQNPSDKLALTQMEAFYKDQGLNRIASYFTGRINNLKEQQ